jgi:hypothetical protein
MRFGTFLNFFQKSAAFVLSPLVIRRSLNDPIDATTDDTDNTDPEAHGRLAPIAGQPRYTERIAQPTRPLRGLAIRAIREIRGRSIRLLRPSLSMDPSDELIPTRWSLLSRLKDAGDARHVRPR